MSVKFVQSTPNMSHRSSFTLADVCVSQAAIMPTRPVSQRYSIMSVVLYVPLMLTHQTLVYSNISRFGFPVGFSRVSRMINDATFKGQCATPQFFFALSLQMSLRYLIFDSVLSANFIICSSHCICVNIPTSVLLCGHSDVQLKVSHIVQRTNVFSVLFALCTLNEII